VAGGGARPLAPVVARRTILLARIASQAACFSHAPTIWRSSGASSAHRWDGGLDELVEFKPRHLARLAGESPGHAGGAGRVRLELGMLVAGRPPAGQSGESLISY
jgi:hypothetical protein